MKKEDLKVGMEIEFQGVNWIITELPEDRPVISFKEVPPGKRSCINVGLHEHNGHSVPNIEQIKIVNHPLFSPIRG